MLPVVAQDWFFRPPRRSWPYPPTRLEVLAIRAGLDDEDLRRLLAQEIERRRREAADQPTRDS